MSDVAKAPNPSDKDDPEVTVVQRELARALFLAEGRPEAEDRDTLKNQRKEAWAGARKQKMHQARRIIRMLEQRGAVKLVATGETPAED